SQKNDILVSCFINSCTIVASATAPDCRSDEEAMLFHCDRGATRKTGPFRRNPKGRWGLRAISSSRFVGDERASACSSLLDSSPRKPHRQRYSYLGDGTLALLDCIPWRCSFPILPRIS